MSSAFLGVCRAGFSQHGYCYLLSLCFYLRTRESFGKSTLDADDVTKCFEQVTSDLTLLRSLLRRRVDSALYRMGPAYRGGLLNAHTLLTGIGHDVTQYG